MRRIAARFLRLAKLVARKGFVALDRLDRALNAGHDEGAHAFFVRRAAAAHDMQAQADERYYGDVYADYVRQHLQRRGMTDNGVLLDLACGQGRLLVRLLAGADLRFGKVVGVDFSDEVLKAAREHLRDALGDGHGVHLERADIVEFLEAFPDAGADVILLFEVLYMLPEPERVLSMLARKLRPGGVAFISLRPRYYYALSALRQGLHERALDTITADEGAIFGSEVRFHWTDAAAIRETFPERYGLEVSDLLGVGVCSGIPGDPHDVICRPSQLDEGERRRLRRLEEDLGRRLPDAGRYLLFAAEAPKASESGAREP